MDMICDKKCPIDQQRPEDQTEYKMRIEIPPFQFTSTNTWQVSNKIPNQNVKQIQIQKRNETLTINSDTIAYMYIECKIVSLINFSGNNSVLPHSLNHYEELLDDNFLRINRQCIVNKNNIKKIISLKGKVSVEMKIPKNKVITITNSKEKEFYKWIKKMPYYHELTEEFE